MARSPDRHSCEEASRTRRHALSAQRDQEFTDYVTARLASLRRLAYLLCQNPGHVDDLVQAAITRLYVHWGRARDVEHIDAYVRTILVRVFLKDRESGWARRVDLHGELPDAAVAAENRDDSLDLRAALAQLPPRQRATLVLRFYCDLTVGQTAEVLGCSPGTVKSQAARGLDALRGRLGPTSATSPRPRAEPQPTRPQPEVQSHG